MRCQLDRRRRVAEGKLQAMREGKAVEHGGRGLLLNRGTRQPEGDPQGFGLCVRCHQRVQSQASGPTLTDLEAQCQSEPERGVLHAIHERRLRLPDEAQRTVYDGDAPVAIADLFHAPCTVVFVDGSPHHQEYVRAADDWKRRRLRALGYRIVVIRGEDLEAGLAELRAHLAG